MKPSVNIDSKQITAAGVLFYSHSSDGKLMLYLMNEGKGFGDIGGRIDAEKDNATTALDVIVKTACRQVDEESNGEFMFNEIYDQIQFAANLGHYAIVKYAKYCMFVVKIDMRAIDIGVVEELTHRKHEGMWKSFDEIKAMTKKEFHPRFNLKEAVKII